MNLIIDDKSIESRENDTVLRASLDAGIYIPHLCHHTELPPIGACGLCAVAIDGMEGLQKACTTSVVEGMRVRTQGPEIQRVRRLAMELMLSGHPPDCANCIKYLNCELQSLKQYLAMDEPGIRRRSKLFPVVSSNPLFTHDRNRCVLCGRCVRACRDMRGVDVLVYKKKGQEMYIGTADDKPLAESGCRFCGACAEVCPTGAIMDKEEFGKGKSRRAALVPCRTACPAEIDVPMYVRFIREKRFDAAVGVIREKVPFPGILGHVCHRPCETACRRGEINESVSIRNLKCYAVDHDEQRTWKTNIIKQEPTDKKVAIIGAGPAGLTAAYYLAIRGHAAVVFDALPLAGGMLRYGIPEYRLPRDVIDTEIDELVQLGVEIRTGSVIESIDSLQKSADYDAILIAVGAQKGMILPIPSVKGDGVLVGTEFMRSVNEGNRPGIGRRVLVIGGGNVALDCARVSLRMGADEARVVCIEAENEMPAAQEEIDEGKREGVSLFTSRTCTRITRQNGIITGAEFSTVKSFSSDEDGNIEIETFEDSAHIIEADTIIFAVGQKPEVPSAEGLNITSRGLIEFDPYTCETSISSVFAAGDAVTGSSSVIDAIVSGRKAASAIDRFLDGSGKLEQKLAPGAVLSGYLGTSSTFASMPRCDGRERCLAGSNDEASDDKKCMDEEFAQYESGRCLQCDLRLAIKPVKFWMNY